MRSVKIKFDGPERVNIDWNAEVQGLPSLAQRASVTCLTKLGSDKIVASRGTSVSESLRKFGTFNLVDIQHTLNFGALKVIRDLRDFEDADSDASERIDRLRLSLIEVKQGFVEVAVVIANAAGQQTREIIETL